MLLFNRELRVARGASEHLAERAQERELNLSIEQMLRGEFQVVGIREFTNFDNYTQTYLEVLVNGSLYGLGFTYTEDSIFLRTVLSTDQVNYNRRRGVRRVRL